MAQRIAQRTGNLEAQRGLAPRAAAAVLLATMLIDGGGMAFALDDPTRPPTALRGDGPRADTSGDDLVLQSVLLSESGRAAIINGELVKLGASVGPARLLRVTESEVVVLVGGKQRRLLLFPGVRKRAAAGAAPAQEKRPQSP